MAGNDVSQSAYVQILQGVNVPVNALTLKFLEAWHANEQSNAANNPFNTTRKETGSTDLGGPTANNGHPVQIYTSEQQGINATIDTLKQPQYRVFLAALRSGQQTSYQGHTILDASFQLLASPWGTSHITDPVSGLTLDKSGVVSNVKGSQEKSLLGNVGTGASQGVQAVGSAFWNAIAGWIGPALKMGLGILLIVLGVYIMVQGQVKMPEASDE